MSSLIKRIVKLMCAFFIYSIGIVLTMKANMGFASWDILHYGLGIKLGMQIGTMSILVGLVIVVIDYFAGEAIGIGTWLNMIFIGSFMNLILALNFIPVSNSLVMSLVMMCAGMFINAIATYLYISAGLGTGPRDCLMVILSRKTGVSAGTCKMVVEWSAVGAGWLLGGPVGVGTVIAAFGGGFFVQIVFNFFKFDPRNVKHETVLQTIKSLKKTVVPTVQ